MASASCRLITAVMDCCSMILLMYANIEHRIEVVVLVWWVAAGWKPCKIPDWLLFVALASQTRLPQFNLNYQLISTSYNDSFALLKWRRLCETCQPLRTNVRNAFLSPASHFPFAFRCLLIPTQHSEMTCSTLTSSPTLHCLATIMFSSRPFSLGKRLHR